MLINLGSNSQNLLKKLTNKQISHFLNMLIHKNGYAVLKGIGAFVSDQVSAQINHNHFHKAPGSKIRFVPKVHFLDLELVNLISNELSITQPKAKSMLSDWLTDIQEVLNTGNLVQLPQLGILKKVQQNYFFEFSNTQECSAEHFGLQDFQLEQITLRQGVSYKRLAFVGILALFLFNLLLLSVLTQQKSAQDYASQIKMEFLTADESSKYALCTYKNLQDLPDVLDFDQPYLAVSSATKMTLSNQYKSSFEYYNQGQFYIITGCFKYFDNAKKYQDKLKKMGYHPGVFLHKGLFKVYSRTSTNKALIESVLQTDQHRISDRAWVM